MLLMVYFSTMSFVISIVVLLAGLVISMHIREDREKSSPFECGFDPKASARIPFSTRFFLLAVVFLVFDIEIGIIMPLPLMMSSSMIYEVLLGGSFFLIILLGGLLHEWREGSLDWKE